MLGFMDNSAVIKKGNTVVVMRLIDGEFPDYTKVIPKGNDKTVLVNRDKLPPFPQEDVHPLQREVQGYQHRSESGAHGDLLQQPGTRRGEGGDRGELRRHQISARFNAKYLIDVLSVMDEQEVELKFKDEFSPVIMNSAKESDFMAVIMPMRL